MRGSRSDAKRSASRQSRKAVGAPPFRADPVVYKEQSCRVIFLLHPQQPRIIAAPVRVLPTLFKKIALRNIRAPVRRHGAKLTHTPADLPARFSYRRHVRLVAA